MKKKLTAAVLSVVMLLMSGSVFAAGTETAEESKYSGEYGAFEQMAKYVAERYIDDSLTEEEIMKQGLSKLLENNDPLLVQLLKSMLESLDDYSEFYTPEEYKAFQDKLNQNFYGIGISMKMWVFSMRTVRLKKRDLKSATRFARLTARTLRAGAYPKCVTK